MRSSYSGVPAFFQRGRCGPDDSAVVLTYIPTPQFTPHSSGIMSQQLAPQLPIASRDAFFLLLSSSPSPSSLHGHSPLVVLRASGCGTSFLANAAWTLRKDERHRPQPSAYPDHRAGMTLLAARIQAVAAVGLPSRGMIPRIGCGRTHQAPQ